MNPTRTKSASLLINLAILWYLLPITISESKDVGHSDGSPFKVATRDNFETEERALGSASLSRGVSCTDTPNDKFYMYKKKSYKTCMWLNNEDKAMVKKLCNNKTFSNATDVCPNVCKDMCPCNDNANDEYTDTFQENIQCEWIANNKKNYKDRSRYCKWQKAASNTCPDTCSMWCRTSDDYVSEVDSEDPPQPVCEDKGKFIYYGKWRSCDWVKLWPESRCERFRVNQFCLRTCGKCAPTVSPPNCADDKEFMIDSKKWKNCAWVAKFSKTRCTFSKVTEGCPLTCGVCSVSNEEYPTSTPTMIVPTVAPSQIPFDNQQCYAGVAKGFTGKQEAMSSREWWNNKQWIQSDRHDWFHKRLMYEPIVGETTLIAGVLFTVSNKKLKMSVLFPPLYPNESDVATILLQGDKNGSVQKSTCSITPNIWHCLFEIESLSEDQSYSYQVSYRPNIKDTDLSQTYVYEGKIPKPAVYPRVAALGCLGKDNTKDKSELVNAVLDTSPNMIVMTGDQTYTHWNLGYGFLETIFTLNELTRSLPTIILMDDHDYGQGSLKGAGDEEEDSGAGFDRPACLMNFIEELTVSHNPDSGSSSQLQNGMSSKYSTYKHGKLDFAITEARKFKNFSSNKNLDSILGHDQEEWLREWCKHDTDSVKVVLAVTPFANLVTNMTSIYHGFIREGNNDRDSNGTPSSGRFRVMEILQGCSQLVISGDQHLGITATYDDYGVSECVTPAVLNSIFWRLNYNAPGASYSDSFGNQYTLHNVWNVDNTVASTYKLPSSTIEEGKHVKNKRGDGFLTVDFDGEHAVCGMHEYWFGQKLKWKESVPASSIRPPCLDDDDFIFKNIPRRNCKWAKRQNISFRCSLRGVADACKLTCGKCPISI